MCHLVSDPSNDVQKMAYQLLREAAKKHTEYVVVEAAVDSEGSYKPQLPSELLSILDRTIDVHEESIEVRASFFIHAYPDLFRIDHLRLFDRLGSYFRSLYGCC